LPVPCPALLFPGSQDALVVALRSPVVRQRGARGIGGIKDFGLGNFCGFPSEFWSEDEKTAEREDLCKRLGEDAIVTCLPEAIALLASVEAIAPESSLPHEQV
jgi:hypothetical protein